MLLHKRSISYFLISGLVIGCVMADMSKNAVPVSELREKLSYDPETGIIRWLIMPSWRATAGDEAGCVQKIRKNGKPHGRFIRVRGILLTGARVAWALYYGEWPTSKVYAVDKNPLNLRIANLTLGKSIPFKIDRSHPEASKIYTREHRKIHGRPNSRKEMLKQKFGISLEDYDRMMELQGGKCAICDRPETQVSRGKVLPLCVDHDHVTTRVRGLLCNSCNTGLGMFKDDPNLVINAATYLARHMRCEIMSEQKEHDRGNYTS